MYDTNYDIELMVDKVKIDSTKKINKIDIVIEELEKEVTIDVPSNIVSGDKLKLKGLGKKKPDGSNGDAYIVFNNIIEVDKMLEKKYKYKYKYIKDVYDFELEDKLNEYAEEGWRCVSVQSIIERAISDTYGEGDIDFEPWYKYSIIFEKENID